MEAQASAWLARRERGLTPAEQDAYLQWLASAPEHSRCIGALERSWRTLDALGEHYALQGAAPHPDLLAPRAKRRTWRYLALGLALAASLAVTVTFWRPRAVEPTPVAAAAAPAPTVKVVAAPQPRVLPDGSTVTLNGGHLDMAYSATERRVRLVGGEGFFTVAKDAARPFLVETGTAVVRAVGTAFDVAPADTGVSVLVTEGVVAVRREDAPAPEAVAVAAGQRARLAAGTMSAPVVTSVSPEEIAQALAWQVDRLEFSEVPLRDVVAAFNARNGRKLVCGDDETARLLVGGSFRADNADGFVRLLETSFGVTTAARDDGSVVLMLFK